MLPPLSACSPAALCACCPAAALHPPSLVACCPRALPAGRCCPPAMLQAQPLAPPLLPAWQSAIQTGTALVGGPVTESLVGRKLQQVGGRRGEARGQCRARGCLLDRALSAAVPCSCMARHVQQARLKSSSPVSQGPWVRATPLPALQAETTAPATATPGRAATTTRVVPLPAVFAPVPELGMLGRRLQQVGLGAHSVGAASLDGAPQRSLGQGRAGQGHTVVLL